MGKLSREKGKLGEREVAQLLRDFGFEARRGQQFRGGSDSPDVVHDIPGLYIEVKRRERVDLYGTLDIAYSEAKTAARPVVFHRKNRKPWLVTLAAEDFLEIMKELHHDR